VIPTNEAPQDQRLTNTFSYQRTPEPALVRTPNRRKGSHASEPEGKRRGRASGSSNVRNDKSQRPQALERDSSDSNSSGSRRSQLVDLVVEDQEAEQREQSRTRRELSLALNEPPHTQYRYVVTLGHVIEVIF
jgi:hypothetical protein